MITKLTNWLKTQNARYAHGGDNHGLRILNCSKCKEEWANLRLEGLKAKQLEKAEKRMIQWILDAMASRGFEGKLTDKLAEIEAEAEFLSSWDYFK